MAMQVPITWVFILIMLSVFMFFAYHIVLASNNSNNTHTIQRDIGRTNEKVYTMPPKIEYPKYIPERKPLIIQQQEKPVKREIIVEKQIPEPIVSEDHSITQNIPGLQKPSSHSDIVRKQIPLPMPSIPGQTHDDITQPDQNQRTPPSVLYNVPEAIDPMNRTVYMNATFGNNLRFPEQMIESHPKRSVDQISSSGIGSNFADNPGFRAVRYTQEMIQNGAMMEEGITGHDLSDSGFGLKYSIL